MRPSLASSYRLIVGSTLTIVAAIACDDSTGPDSSLDVASVVITPDARTFTAINDSARLAAEAKNPAGGTISGTTFVWSSLETNIASVDQTGMVKARGVGTARIVASASGRADTATITVTQTAARVVLTPGADTINAIGDVVAFTAVVTDANDVPLTNPTITWSTTTPAIVSVTGGNVTSLATGSGVVIATSGTVADTVAVLSRQIAATLTVAPSPVAVMVGETQQLTATAADSNGVAIPSSAITWASGAQGIATVSSTGVVRGESPGGATVTATAPGRSVDVPITVQPGAPTGPLSWSIAHRGLVVGTNEPLGIMGSGPTDVFFVGRSGGIYRFDGTRWSRLEGGVGTPATTQLRGFWGTSSTSFWAAGTDTRPDPNTGGPIRSGRIYRVTGTTGTLVYTGQDFVTDFYDVSGTSDTDVWVAGSQIFHHDGVAWTPSFVPGVTTTFTAIWAASPTSVFAGTNRGALYRWDGSNWMPESPDNSFQVNDIWGTSPTDVWAVDDGGFVRHWNGTTWEVSTRFNVAAHSVHGTSPSDVWVGGMMAHWNGSTWFTVDPATTAVGGRIWMSSPTSGWFVGSNGELSQLRPDGWTRHWDSPGTFGAIAGSGSDVWVCGHRGTIQHLSGGTWSTERLPRSEACGSVSAASTNDVLAGAGASIYYRFQGGAWSVIPTGTGNGFRDMWTTATGHTYAVDLSATVYRFEGGNWIAMPTGSPNLLRGVWASGPNDVFAVGDNATVMHYNGTSWTKLETGTTGTLHSLWGSSPTNVFIVGSSTNGGLVLRYNGTGFTASHPTPHPLKAVHGRSPNEVYAVGEQGTIIRFNGTAWSTEASGVDTPLEDVWATSTGDVYVVGFPSLILRGTR